MKQSKIYLVVAYTGEYSDHTVVFVRAFKSKEAATAVSDRYQIEADAYKKSSAFKDRYGKDTDFKTSDRLFAMHSDYTGISFDVHEISFSKE